MDELSVARTLMGVSPSDMNSNSSVSSSNVPLDSYAGLESLAEQAHAMQASVASHSPEKQDEDSCGLVAAKERALSVENSKLSEPPSPNAGLDALAALASEEATNITPPGEPLEPYLAASGIVTSAPTSSDEEESEQMPPPPPRRRRSASNPEGMEKWDSLNRARSGGGARRHFVLPEAILEEELAEANAAVRERELLKTEQKPKEPELAVETYTNEILKDVTKKTQLDLKQQGNNIAYKE